MQYLGRIISAIDLKLSHLLPLLDFEASTPPNPTSTFTAVKAPDIGPSEPFKGKLDKCGRFIIQYKLACSHAPIPFATNASQITFVVHSLRDVDVKWYTTYLNSCAIETLTFDAFLKDFLRVLDHPPHREEADKKTLLALRQGKQTVVKHFIYF